MDCLEFLREQPDKSFDLAVVDPPYGGANDLCINGGGAFRWKVRPLQERAGHGRRSTEKKS